MNRKKLLITTLKLIALVSIFAFSALNLQSTLSDSLKETNQLTFINNPSDESYAVKKFAFISGAIKNPGIYELKNDNTRLADLIELAGGLTPSADINYINKKLNLSSVIKDTDHVVIPNIPVSYLKTKTASNLTNINTASSSELDTLPGIGASTAQKIIDARPFASIEDLKDVSGIGVSKFNQIKDLITVE